MARTVALNTSASITLDSSGNGTAEIGPVVPGETWFVANEACSTQSVTNQSTFYLYLGTVSDGNLLGGSFSGNFDSASIAVTLHTGAVLIGKWTGGDPSVSATLSLYGTRQVPG